MYPSKDRKKCCKKKVKITLHDQNNNAMDPSLLAFANLYYAAVLIDRDFDAFSALFSPNAEIFYTYNGAKTTVTVKQMLDRMKRGFFDNIEKMFINYTNTESGGGNYLILKSSGKSLRYGYGRDEDGPGWYTVIAEGKILVENGMIIQFNYKFTKTKEKIEVTDPR